MDLYMSYLYLLCNTNTKCFYKYRGKARKRKLLLPSDIYSLDFFFTLLYFVEIRGEVSKNGN